MAKKVLIDLLGKQFGKLRVVARAANTGAKRNIAVWTCACECGAVKDVLAGNLLSGKSLSCGCSRVRHNKWKVPEYAAWCAMIQRCSNPNCKAYNNYGGRGITVCAEWSDFAKFYADMGSRPTPQHSLERIDNDKGYGPDNCTWATRVAQGRNRRTSKVTEQMAAEVRQSSEHQQVLAKRYGVSQATISRIKTNQVWPSQHRQRETP